MAPINIKQTSLLKFSPDLSNSKKPDIIIEKDEGDSLSSDSRYNLSIERDNTVEILETHCLDCGQRLKKNGFNNKTAILDLGLGEHEFKLHRKRCHECGEIKPDYSKLAPKYGNYHENYKRRARQHYLDGLNPAQIKNVFENDFGVSISKSSIVNWVNEVQEPLRETLEETPVPSSGVWGYDEIHLNVSKKKRYSINTVDMNTRFIPVAKIKKKMGKKSGREVLLEGKRGRKLKIKCIVKDCSTNLGSLFHQRGFKNVILQNCLTHVKWIISKHVKAFAGLSKQSRKPVPKEWRWLLYRFYRLLDLDNEADTYIHLEALRKTVEDLNGTRIKELHVAIRQLEGWLPKIIAHQRDPEIPRTNNVTEGFHKKFEYYRAFKTQMKTDKGAQRVLDYRAYGHNLKQFPGYISHYEQKYETWRALVRKNGDDAILRGQSNHFRSMFRKLEAWHGNYQLIWEEYFAVIND